MKFPISHIYTISILAFLLNFGCTGTTERHKSDSGNSYTSWEVYGGDLKGTHYSELNQINKTNVSQLHVAWRYHTGDMKISPSSTIQCNPIIVGGIMYITTPSLKAVALDAKTGQELWVYNPWQGNESRGTNRGLTYWSDGMEQRLFYGVGHNLHAIDAKTGKAADEFGSKGQIDLRLGLDRQALQHASLNTPGVIYKNLIIIGSAVGEGPNPGAPGHVRAYDVRTGERKWIFHTIPQPGEYGYDTWSPNSWKTNGGANNWSNFTIDTERGLVFFGTGSPSYDHWGGNRVGDNLFANCIMALNAETGKYVWHYQVVHHDLWDYDIPCAPTLVTLTKDGEKIDAVAQPTKMGHLFILDRETGEPVFPIEEKRVPQSDIPGEISAPTQPFPLSSLKYAQQGFGPDQITDLNPGATAFVTEEVKAMSMGEVFTPPGLKPLIIMPQFNGGSEWPGAAYDPTTQTLIVNASNEAEWISMVKSEANKETTFGELGKQIFQSTCTQCHSRLDTNQVTNTAIPTLQGVQNRMSKDQLNSLLLIGRGQMPSFETLTELERQAIVSYIFQEGQEKKVTAKDLKSSSIAQMPFISTGHWDFRDSEGFPINKRPWGTLNAIDLNEGKIKWQVPLGTYPELETKGIPPTGTFNIGGAVVTAGGLIFIGATRDERIHAYDKDTGTLLWEFQMEAGGYATPATYEIDGRQYLVIAAGGGGKPGTKPGDSYYCFTLPQ